MDHLRRRRNPALWHQINRILIGLIVFAVLVFALLNFYPEWVRCTQLTQQLKTEQEKLRTEQRLQKKREREVVLLQTDPDYVEIIARDKLGVMKEGETIFRLENGRSQSGEPVREKIQ